MPAEQPVAQPAQATPRPEALQPQDTNPTPERVQLVDTTPAPRPRRQPAAGGATTPEGVLRLMRSDAGTRRDEARKLVQLAHEDRLNFNNLAAEEKLEIAVRLDPQNEEASAMLAQVRAELGDPRGEVFQVKRDFDNATRANLQLVRSEINLLINRGRRYDEDAEHEKAIRAYEKALELIRHNSLNLRLDDEEKLARNLLERSRQLKIERDERDRLQQERMIELAKEAEEESNLRFLKNRIEELRERAQEAFENRNFELAEENAEAILRTNPEDREAAELKRAARHNKHLQRRMQLFNDAADYGRRAMLSVAESSILYHEIFTFPPRREWEAMAPSDPTLAELIQQEQTEVDRDIRRRLQQPQDITFPPDTPFSEAIVSLRQITGLNIILNKDAKDLVEGINIELPRVSNLELSKVLNLLLSKVESENLTFSIEDGAVVIGPKSSLLDENLIPHFYDIKDIIQAHPDFPAPPLALDSLQGRDTDTGFGGDLGLDEPDITGAPSEQTIRDLVEAEITDPVTQEPVGSVDFEQGKLAVRTTFENHQKIESLLEELRKSTGVMVTVESRFLALQDNFLEEIGVDIGNGNSTFLPNSIPDVDGTGTSLAPGYEFLNAAQDWNVRAATIGDFSNPVGSRVNPFNITSSGGGAYQLNVLTDQYQLEAILTGVTKQQELRNLSSPRVTAFNTQVAHTLVINQAAYIKDLEVNQTGVVPVINPQIGVLNSGSILEVRPNVSHDRKYIVLEIQPTLSERLDSEFAILNLSGNLTVVPVELPVTSVTQIKTTVTIPDGGTVLVGGLKRELRSKQSIGVPGIRHVPVLNLIFGRKGNSTLRSVLFVLINAKITIVQEEEERLFNI